VLGNLGRPERRSVSFQSVWGRGDSWTAEGRSAAVDGLRLATVVACVNLRANTLAQLPLKAYRTGADGLPVEVPVQPKLVESPSNLPRSQWLRQMSISRDIFGNAFGMIVGRDAAGWPTAVEWLDPSKVQTSQDFAFGPLRFRYGADVLPDGDVLVVPGMPVPGSPLGISPLERSGLIDLARKAQEFGADWYENSGVPSGLLYADQELDAEQAERIRSSVSASWKKRRPAVLGSGLRYESVSSNVEQSPTETMRHTAREVARLFGVDPAMVGLGESGSSVVYQNREVMAQAFLVNTMNAELVLVQEVLTANLPKPQFARFSTGAFLRSDLQTRYASFATALAAGFLTVDEVRELEDRPALPTPTVAPGGSVNA
jgi:HK97 family phage portal protein